MVCLILPGFDLYVNGIIPYVFPDLFLLLVFEINPCCHTWVEFILFTQLFAVLLTDILIVYRSFLCVGLL